MPATRRIANESELVAGLAQAQNADVCVVDFAEIPIERQIVAVADTDVLVGVSGAGMTNLIWLGPTAAVVEIAPSAAFQPACFGNLAAEPFFRFPPLYSSTVRLVLYVW